MTKISKEILGGFKMLKGKNKLITALILGLSLGAGTVVNASTQMDTTEVNTSIQAQPKMHKCNGGQGTLYRVLKDKLGISELEIQNASSSGKTAFDLAKTKGYTPEQLKTILIDEQSKKIDEELKAGKVTKENAVTMKNDFNAKIQKWDGSLKHKEGYGGKHKSAYKVLKDKLGYSDSSIEKAVKEGKSAFDLASEKKVTPDQFKEMVIEEQSKRIDSAVSDGKITKEEGESRKSKLKLHMQNWDGNLKHKETDSKKK